MEKIRICLIGAGRVGKVHALSLKNNIPEAELVAVVEKDEEVVQRFTKEFGLKKSFKDHRDALEWGEFDAIIITTPTFTHKMITVDAAHAKKHIFCEKPMALNVEEADEMVQEVEKAKVKLQIGFMRRFDRGFLAAKQKVERGLIGEPVLIKSTTRGPGLPPEWARDVSKSGGMLAEVGSHDFDTLKWFAESKFKEIFAFATNYKCYELKKKYPDFYDHAIIIARFQNERLGMIDIGCPVDYGYDARTEILGTNGVIFVGTVEDNELVVCTKNGGAASPLHSSWRNRFKEAYIDELKYFVSIVKGDGEPLVSGKDGKEIVEAVVAANKSIQTGHSVILSP